MHSMSKLRRTTLEGAGKAIASMASEQCGLREPEGELSGWWKVGVFSHGPEMGHQPRPQHQVAGGSKYQTRDPTILRTPF